MEQSHWRSPDLLKATEAAGRGAVLNFSRNAERSYDSVLGFEPNLCAPLKGSLVRPPMKRKMRMLLLAATVLAVASAHAKDKKKQAVPAVLGKAQYVYLEAVDGDEFDPNLLPEDRQAIANVRKALRNWGRYILTVNRQDAELLFIVRKGRVADIRGMVGTGGMGRPGPVGPAGGPMQGGLGVGAGSEVGPPNDMLEVKIIAPDGRDGAQIWMHSERDGLNAPDVTLVQELRTAVDRDYPPEKPKKP